MKIIDKSLVLAHQLFSQKYDPKSQANWHFAFAYRRNNLLAIGQNDMNCPDATTWRFAKKFGGHRDFPTRHAEIDVISKLWGKVYIDNSIKLVVLRLNRFGNLGNSKPCRNCMTILNALNVCKVYYSDAKGEIVKL